MRKGTVMNLLAALAIFLLLITPVTLRVDLRHEEATNALLAVRFWGLGPDLRYRLKMTDEGHRVFRVDRKGAERPLRATNTSSATPTLTILRAVMRGAHARQRFLRGVTLLRLDVALNVSLGDAARTALTAGAIQSLWRALPCHWRRRARLQVRPDFLNGRGSVQARCMVFFRLGTMIFAAALLLLSVLAQHAAHPVQPAKEA